MKWRKTDFQKRKSQENGILVSVRAPTCQLARAFNTTMVTGLELRLVFAVARLYGLYSPLLVISFISLFGKASALKR